ncbi:STM3941 family protein [Apibacter mensalis]|uniref:STM3941 family protein n=1 Tax=Apibacter mensalis TaxID=1586267 RepID=UPI0026F00549|nr:STM3941 family protein [Apibacter mensalis]
MSKIEIFISKKKVIIQFFIALLFIFLGILFIFYPKEFVSPVFKSVFLIRLSGILSVLFFGAVILIISKELFVIKKKGLVIDEYGIIDHSNYSSVGEIKWDDVISIKKNQVMSTKFLLVYVKKPKVYLYLTDGIIKNKLRKLNMRYYGTPITISSSSLKCDFNQLENDLKKSFEEYKMRNYI